MDESPAYMGGKENQWRKLNLDGKSIALPLPGLTPPHSSPCHSFLHTCIPLSLTLLPSPLSPPPPPLTVLPRHSFLYNIVDFLTRAHLPGGMSLERMQSLTRPPTQAEQIEYIKAVSSMRSVVSTDRVHQGCLLHEVCSEYR